MIKVDARRLLCPLPVIRLQNTVKGVASGSQITITCTDPGTHHDIPTWCRLYRHRVLSVTEQSSDLGTEIVFVVEVA